MRFAHFALSSLILIGTLTLAQSIIPFVKQPLVLSKAGISAYSNVELPLAFEANRGQVMGAADFVTRGQGYSAQLRANGLTLGVSSQAEAGGQEIPDAIVEITLVGANRRAEVKGEQKLPGHSNYLSGSDPAGWITDVEQYGRVRYSNVYPGIDVLYHGNQSRLEHDFVLHPGANATQIQFTYVGIRQVTLNRDGDLVLETRTGAIILQKPRAYQMVGGKEIGVGAEYTMKSGRTGLRVGRYDRRRTLVIDPVVLYSTFLGGTLPSGLTQYASAVALDGAGNLYVAGVTSSTNFPTTSGALQTTYPSPCECYSIFISKINAAGTALIYSTYISGMGTSIAGLAVDAMDNVFVSGEGRDGLPIPAGSSPFQSTPKGIAVLKLNSAGNGVLYATYLGGSGDDQPTAFAVDAAGDTYITGMAVSNDFPLKNPLQSTLGPSGTSFVTEINPTMTGLVYSTYLSGTASYVVAFGIAVDPSANAYIVGIANTNGFPVVNALQSTCSYACAFITKISSAGASLAYSTYFGTEVVPALAVSVDNSGDAYLTGSVNSTASVPLLHPFQSTFTGSQAAFVAELDTTGALQFSTYLGDASFSSAIALDSSKNVYITGMLGAGSGESGDIPLVNAIYKSEPCSTSTPCGFVSELNSAGTALVFSSILPETTGTPLEIGLGTRPVGPQAVIPDASGNIYVAGSVSSEPDFAGYPVFNALQPSSAVGSASDAFIMKISPAGGAAAGVAPSVLQFPIQQVGTTSAGFGMLLYNLGTDPVTLSNVSTTGDFAIQVDDCPTVVSASGRCGIGVTFTPTTTGTRNGSLIISNSSSENPQTVMLTGLGAQPTVALSPTSLTFANQAVGTTSAQQTIVIKANGGLNIEVGYIAITGNFSERNVNCSVINAQDGSSCQIYVTFAPTATGTQTGTLTITDNAINSSQNVSLIGTGVPPNLGLSTTPGSSSSVTVAPGATAKYSLSIGGAGLGGTASLTCSGAPTGANCSVPASVAVTATSAATFNVTVSTTPTMAKFHSFGFRPVPWLWAVALMGFVVLPKKEMLRHHSASLSLLFLSALLLLAICSCGGSGGGNSGGTTTPAGSYTLIVTAQDGSTSQSTKLTLTVR
jgi:hypothetical protein